MLDVVGANILSYRYNNWQQDFQRVMIAAMIPTAYSFSPLYSFHSSSWFSENIGAKH